MTACAPADALQPFPCRAPSCTARFSRDDDRREHERTNHPVVVHREVAVAPIQATPWLGTVLNAAATTHPSPAPILQPASSTHSIPAAPLQPVSTQPLPRASTFRAPPTTQHATAPPQLDNATQQGATATMSRAVWGGHSYSRDELHRRMLASAIPGLARGDRPTRTSPEPPSLPVRGRGRGRGRASAPVRAARSPGHITQLPIEPPADPFHQVVHVESVVGPYVRPVGIDTHSVTVPSPGQPRAIAPRPGQPLPLATPPLAIRDETPSAVGSAYFQPVSRVTFHEPRGGRRPQSGRGRR